MKKKHIFALIIIAFAIAIIVGTAGSASIYVGFEEAQHMASERNHASIHVVGTLKRNSTGEITGITYGTDKLSSSFILVDEKGKEENIHYNEPIPHDLIQSEKVVVIGRYYEKDFVAERILLKCPSKYENKSVNSTSES